MKKLKICQVTHALYPDWTGGFAVIVDQLAKYQSKKGHKVKVFTWNVKNKLKPYEKKHYTIKRFKRIRMPWEIFGLKNPITPMMYWSLFKEDFDIAHLHSQLFFSSFFASIIAKIRKKPVVTTVHGVIAKRGAIESFLQHLYLNTFSKIIFSFSDKIVCLTDFDARQIKKLGANPDKIKIIPNGIEGDIFKPAGIEKDYVLYLGRLVKEKGVDYFVNAAIIAAKKNKDIDFLIIGEGPLKNSISKTISKAKLSKRIKLIGKKPRKEVVRYIQKAKFLVFPSISEGFPMTIIEAMACGRAVIATNVCGIPEIVAKNKTGLLVPPKDSIELARCMIHLFENEVLRKNMSKKAIDRFRKNYTLDSVAKKIEGLYSKCLINSK